MNINYEVLGQISESTKRFTDTLNSIVDSFANSEDFKRFIRGMEILENLQRFGEHNWVLLSPEMYVDIKNMSKVEIDNHCTSFIDNNRGVYDMIKETLLNTSLLSEKEQLFIQIFNTIDNCNYAVASIALSTMMEYLLAKETNFNSIRLRKMADRFMDNVGDITFDQEGVHYLFGLNGFLKNYIKDTKGFEKDKELPYINRHWVAHGRMYRDLIKTDMYQILLAIFAFVKIVEGEMDCEED